MNKPRAMITRFAVALLLTISLCLLQPTAGAVAVMLDPVTQSVAAGDAVRVQVLVADVPNMGAYQVTLHFVPQAMNVSQVAEGEFMKSVGSTLGAGLEQIDNTAGRVTFFYSLTSRGASVTGSGALATVTFNTATTANGTFELLLHDILIVNATGTPIPVQTVANGTCTLTQAGEPTPGSDSGGGNGNEPTAVPLLTSTPGEPSPSSTPGESLPSIVIPGTPPATSAGSETAPVTSAGSTNTPATGKGPETAPAPDEAPATKIPGFTAVGAGGSVLVAVVAYALRMHRRSKHHEK